MNGSISSISSSERAILVERFQSGDPNAFDEIVDRYHRYVFSLTYHFTHNPEDAHDICQEVFVKVFKSLGNLREGSTFHTWLRRITVNACIDRLRQQKKDPVLDEMNYALIAANTETPDHPVEARELRRAISNAVDQLPNRQRQVFILRHYEDLSLKEVARTLECPLGTVKANLFHATRRLRGLLLPYVS